MLDALESVVHPIDVELYLHLERSALALIGDRDADDWPTRKCFEDVLGHRAADKLLRRVQFHYTPKHASWLNMAEIEIGILSRQCLDRRLPDRQTLRHAVEQWQLARNATHQTIEWTFTRQDADRKLGRHYVPLFTVLLY